MFGYFSRNNFSRSKDVEICGTKIAQGAYWFDEFGNERLVSVVTENKFPPDFENDFIFVGKVSRFSRTY